MVSSRLRHQLARNARTFAERYDYRTTYRPYIEFLEPHLPPAGRGGMDTDIEGAWH
jgi:hypothetical protein